MRTKHLPAHRRIVVAALAGLVAFVISVPTTPYAAAEEPLDRQAVQHFVDGYRSRHGLPGIAVSVVQDGEPIYQTGSGDGITADTRMGIGSVSKVITAFAVLQLVDVGKIGLDDPVIKDLPEFVMNDPRATKITIRELLDHTSGLPNPVLVPPANTPKQRVAQLRDLELGSEPGTNYAYSNLGYQTAARLVEVLSGRPFDRYLDEHLFSPLGMEDSESVITKSDQPGLGDGHVTAYGTAIGLPEMEAMNAGSGDVISTAHDLSLFLAMQQRGGVAADGTRLLSEKLINQAQRLQPNAGYSGLGWQHTQTADPARIGKDGSLTRYSSRIDLVPSSGYGVAVLLNSYTPIYKHPFEISTGIIDLTDGRSASPGVPVATIIDGILGLFSLAVLGLGLRGVLRAKGWAHRRTARSGWRFGLRLLPQLIMPVAAVIIFGVLPLIKNNTASPVDAFGLWPAAMVLLLAAAVVGLVLTVIRIRFRVVGPVE